MQQKLLKQFENCLIATGFLQDAGKAQLAEAITSDLRSILSKLISEGPNSSGLIVQMMETHTNPWVRYHCTMVVMKTQPVKAAACLEELESLDGMFAPLCTLALDIIKNASLKH